MIKHATPERVAFPVEALAQFMQVLEKKEMRMHSVLMMRGEEIFQENFRLSLKAPEIRAFRRI